MNEKQDAPSKEQLTYRLVGKKELGEQGWNTSDDYVIYPGQTKPLAQIQKNKHLPRTGRSILFGNNPR
jgi:hypothetical protein